MHATFYSSYVCAARCFHLFYVLLMFAFPEITLNEKKNAEKS